MVSRHPRRIGRSKKVFVLTGLILAGLLAWFLYLVFSGTMFLYRSNEKIKEKLLIKTPVGTSLEEVRDFLKEMDWKIREDAPFYKVAGRPQGRQTLKSDYNLKVWIGDYQGIPWGVSVIAIWGFESGLLTEIVVYKERDAL